MLVPLAAAGRRRRRCCGSHPAARTSAPRSPSNHLLCAFSPCSYVVYYLNRYLGKYVDGIDGKSLR